MKNKIFITGIAGFLGSHLGENFIKDGHEVIGCDNLIGGDLENVPNGAVFHKTDCSDFHEMRKIIDGCDTVYHCAALAHEGLSVFSPKIIADNIFSSSVSVMTAAVDSGVNNFIFCSSMARYGTNDVPFTEDMAPRPQDPYGISKVAAESLLINLSEVHGIDHVIAVPHNIIGPKQKYDDPYRNVCAIMANRMLLGKQPIIYGDGNQVRSFSHIADVISPMMKMLSIKDAIGEVINIGPDGDSITINRLAEIVADCIDFDLKPIFHDARPAEVKFAHCSSDKSRNILDYKTTKTIEEGVRDTVDWIKERGPRPFNYHIDIEINNDNCPKTWKERLL